MDTCSECGGRLALNDRREYVCQVCGLVHPSDESYIKPVISVFKELLSSPTARQYTYPVRLHAARGVGSYIGLPGLVSSAKINPKLRHQAIKLRRIHESQVRAGKAASLFHIEGVILRVSSYLGISSTIAYRALALFKKAMMSEVCRKTNYASLAAACLLITLRSTGVSSVTVKRLLEAFQRLKHRVTFRSLSKAVIYVKKNLKLKLPTSRHLDYLNPIVSRVLETDEVRASIKKLNLSAEEFKAKLLNKAIELLSLLNEKEVGGRSPYIVAIAAVYAASKRVFEGTCILTQSLLSKTFDVGEFTIREHYNKLFRRIVEGAQT